MALCRASARARVLQRTIHTSAIASTSSAPFVSDAAAELVLPEAAETLVTYGSLAPTLLQPLSTYLVELPPALALSYAVFIPLATLALRTSLTLPTTLWQRARTRKFAEVVMPEIRIAQERARFDVRRECRAAGLDYEQYQVAFKKRAVEEAKRLSAVHGCRPLVTMLVPPLLHVPVFILTTLAIRDACQRALVSLPFLPTSPTPIADDYPRSLSQLHDFAGSSLLWCDSVIMPDPTLALPLMVGLIALINVEIGARNRQAIARAMRAGEVDRLEDVRKSQTSAGRQETRAALRDKAVKQWEAQQRRGYAVMVRRQRVMPKDGVEAARVRALSEAETAALEKQTSEAEEEPRTARIVTNVLRVTAVIFIPIFAQAPAAVCAYWLTSNLYTLVQNLSFAWSDRTRERERVARRLMK